MLLYAEQAFRNEGGTEWNRSCIFMKREGIVNLNLLELLNRLDDAKQLLFLSFGAIGKTGQNLFGNRIG